MHFLNSSALWLLALLPGLVVLHLLRRPRPHYWVSNAYLWPTAPEPRVAGLRFLRRPPDWPLILQLGFLSAVILALAQPVIVVSRSPIRRLAFIIDASASMQTLEQGKSRFDMARERALAYLDSLAPTDQVWLILAKSRPLTISDFLAPKQTLRHLMLGLTPADTPADLTAALLLALPTADAVYLFSDGTENATLPSGLQLDRVHYVQVGESDNNVAISRLTVRRNPVSPYDQELFAEVVNHSNQPHTVRFGLSIDTTPLRDERFTLQPGTRRALVAGNFRHQQGIVTAHIDAADHLAVDNRAYTILEPPDVASVLVVSQGNRFVDTVLDQNPLVTRTSIRPESYRHHDMAADFDVVIFDGVEPPDLTQGRFVFINPQPARSEALASDLSTPHPRHPIMAFVDPNAIGVVRGAPLRVPAGGTVLLTAGTLPILVADAQPGLKTVTLGFDLRDSNLPLSVAFPILMSNILQWLTASTVPAHTQLSAGEPLHWEMPHQLSGHRHSDASPGRGVTIKTPQGTWVEVAPFDHTLVFEATDTIGIYTIHGNGYEWRFAVNLNHTVESNIRPVFVPASEPVVSTRVASHLRRLGLWRYLLGTALLILLVEWAVVCRRGGG